MLKNNENNRIQAPWVKIQLNGRESKGPLAPTWPGG